MSHFPSEVEFKPTLEVVILEIYARPWLWLWCVFVVFLCGLCDLRHTFATRLADQGFSVTTIAALLGHTNTAMTDRYTHATDGALRAAVECANGKPVTTESQTPKQPLMRVAVSS
jgi:hypothetical protein